MSDTEDEKRNDEERNYGKRVHTYIHLQKDGQWKKCTEVICNLGKQWRKRMSTGRVVKLLSSDLESGNRERGKKRKKETLPAVEKKR
jgi:hypothetical protein